VVWPTAEAGDAVEMSRSRILVALAPLALVACAHTQALGGFEFDVPHGWEVEAEDGAMIVTEPESAWVWAFAVEDARLLQEHESGLTGASHAIAASVVAAEQASDGEFELGESRALYLGEGISAVSMSGRAVVEGIEVRVWVVIAIAGGEALIGIGFRRPGAGAREDSKAMDLVYGVRRR
jgi:hypothetical protein